MATLKTKEKKFYLTLATFVRRVSLNKIKMNVEEYLLINFECFVQLANHVFEKKDVKTL